MEPLCSYHISMLRWLCHEHMPSKEASNHGVRFMRFGVDSWVWTDVSSLARPSETLTPYKMLGWFSIANTHEGDRMPMISYSTSTSRLHDSENTRDQRACVARGTQAWERSAKGSFQQAPLPTGLVFYTAWRMHASTMLQIRSQELQLQKTGNRACLSSEGLLADFFRAMSACVTQEA